MTKRLSPFAFSLLLTLLASTPGLLGQPNWEPVGPGGDQLYDIDISASGTIYAQGTEQAYIRRAADTSWRAFEYYDSLSDRLRRGFEIVALDSLVMLVTRNGKYYLSRDNGVTWQEKEPWPRDWGRVSSLQAVRIRDTIFLSGADWGDILLASTDEGDTWVEVAEVSRISGSATDGNSLYLYSNLFGLFRRSEGITSEIGPLYHSLESFALIGDTMFIATKTPIENEPLYFRSHDGGETWSESPLETKSMVTVLDGELVAFDDTGVYVALPYDENWRQIATVDEPVGWYVGSVPLGNGLVVATGRGAFRFVKDVEGSSFVRWSENIYGVPLSHLFPYGDSILAIVGDRTPVAIRPDGTGWSFTDIYASAFGWFISEDQVFYTLNIGDSLLLRTRDLGMTYDTLRLDYRGRGLRRMYAEGNRIVIGDEGGFLHTSSDGGVTWTSVSVGDEVYMFDGSGETIFATVAYENDVMIRSLDGGRSWDSIELPPDTRGLFQYSEGTLVVNNDRRLFRSTDFGETWDTLTVPADGDTGPDVTTFRRTALSGDTIAIATNEPSILLSTDLGETWRRLTDPPYTSNSLLLYDGDVFTGFTGRGLWRLDLGEGTGAVEGDGEWVRWLDLR